ncbi:unnamed protein product, partial [marine sediment metagenome]
LSILNPIITVSNGIGYSVGQFSHWDPLDYWIMWFWQQCVLMIVLAIIGAYFVIFGYRSRKYNAQADMKSDNPATKHTILPTPTLLNPTPAPIIATKPIIMLRTIFILYSYM